MHFLEITITGFWPIVGTIVTSGAICFCFGVLVGRNNAAELTKDRDKALADLTAVKSQLANIKAEGIIAQPAAKKL